MAKAGFGRATHVFSMLGEAGPFLVEAKRRGLKIISDIYIQLSAERILADERSRYPTWEPDTPDFSAIARTFSMDDILRTCTDLYICPSEVVQQDLVNNWGVLIGNTALVPYGMSSQWLKLEPRPIRGRILFAGSAELRKGIHYFAMAAQRLTIKGRRYDFRVAGNASPAIVRRPECASLTFLGRVPRDEMYQEYRSADLVVLPTLAEGSAEVIYEALAAGVPVITTPSAGSVVRDLIEGRIIAERDPGALASAIEQLVEERTLRNQMAEAARERAQDYTWERYSDRFVATLKAFT
jgi:glycosyltransferase involved in cell wall biosynthesis